jgi:hypothetical protein
VVAFRLMNDSARGTADERSWKHPDGWSWAVFFVRWVLGLIFFMAGWWKTFELGPVGHAQFWRNGWHLFLGRSLGDRGRSRRPGTSRLPRRRNVDCAETSNKHATARTTPSSRARGRERVCPCLVTDLPSGWHLSRLSIGDSALQDLYDDIIRFGDGDLAQRPTRSRPPGDVIVRRAPAMAPKSAVSLLRNCRYSPWKHDANP